MAQTKKTINIKTDFRPVAVDCPMNDRLIAVSKLETQKERNAAYDALLREVDTGLKERFAEQADKHDVRPADIHNMFGVNYDMLSKIFKKEKHIPTDIMADVCYGLFNFSCNELVFGEPSRIMIPNQMAAVINMLESSPDVDQEQIIGMIKEKYKDRMIRTPLGTPISKEMVHDRLRGIINDSGMHLRSYSLKNDWADSVKLRIQIRPDMFEGAVPSVKRLIGYSFRWRQSIDYFIARDYTTYSNLYYRNGNELCEIQSELYKTLVRIYILLKPEDQAEMVADLFFAHMLTK